MSASYWTQNETEIGRNLDAAERAERCLCARTRRWRRMLARRVHAGELVSPFQGAYARTSYWERLSPQSRALHVIRSAAMLHHDWVFCHESAALAHGLEVSGPNPGIVHILMPPDCHSKSTQSVIRHAGSVGETTMASGVRVTTFARTVADCLRKLTFPQGLAVADSALRRTGWSREELRSVYLGVTPRLRGRRHGLATIDHADGRAENGGESVARGVMIELGFATPDLQVELDNPLDPSHPYRIDFAWKRADGRPIFGELDGRDKYKDAGTIDSAHALNKFSDERLRESRLTLYDASIMRFPFKLVHNRAEFRRLLLGYGVPYRDDQQKPALPPL